MPLWLVVLRRRLPRARPDATMPPTRTTPETRPKLKIPVEDGYFRIPEHPEAPPVLLGSYSPAAKTYFWPRRKRCPITMEAVEDCELSSEGVIYSWTFVL